MPVLSTPLPADLLNAEPTLGTAAPWRLSIAFMNMPPPQEPIDLTVSEPNLILTVHSIDGYKLWYFVPI
ncbi:hypothetical protein RR48_07063 [Papilio machaon]|uniref:Uncharacterized protein n=1 Tax=Papilio machaon TaxID=76193 RepID=A0A194R6P2_PAPMA|nr:hypothetical protein RR48_07063 [Papilio machaon]